MKTYNIRTLGRFAKRPIAFALVFLFLLTPLIPVQAAEENPVPVQVPAAEESVEKPSNTQENKEEKVINDQDKEIQKEEEKEKENTDSEGKASEEKKPKKDEEEGGVQSKAMASGTPTSIDQAKISNSSRVSVDVDHASGALVYNYGISVPEGRNGMTPQVSISYNSEDKDNASEVGFGWSLSIPKIERQNKRGTDILNTNNDFTSSLSGELVNTTGSNYAAKVEDGSFLQYVLASNVWTVTAKDGTVYTFGGVSDARVADANNANKISTWYLTKQQDTNGNYITYAYYKDTTDNAVYPSAITYTNHTSLSGIYAVNFLRENRPDNYTSYATGFLTKITKRLSSIEVTTNGSWTRKYQLNYSAGDNGSRSMLTSIIESGRDESAVTTALPALNIAYTTGQNSLTYNGNIDFPTVTYTDTNNQQQTEPFTFADQYVRLMDVNADGLKDIVKSYNVQINGIDYPIFWVLKNNGHGWSVDNSWAQPTYTYTDGNNNVQTNKFVFTSGVDVGDWNGDAKDDLIRFWSEDIGGGNRLQHAVVLLNTGSGWTQDNTVNTDVPTYTDQNGNPAELYIESGSSAQNYFIDLNGDGLLDYIHSTNSQINGIDYPVFAVLYNRGGNLVWDNTVTVPTMQFMSGGTQVNAVLSLTSSVKMLDINGDHLVDFVYANNYQVNGIDYPSFWVLLNNGHGWTQDTTYTHPTYTFLDGSNVQHTGYFSTTSPGFRTIDLNGDGLIDWLRLWSIDIGGGQSVNRKVVLASTGSGWVQNDSLITVGEYSYLDQNNTIQYGYPNTGASTTTLFADINGDGLDDILNAHFYYSGGNVYTVNWFMQNTGSISNVASQLTLPEGGSYQFTYKQTSTYTDGSGNLLNPKLPSTYNTLRTVVTNDANGNTGTTTYEYADGTFYYNGPYDRKFAGFGKITTTDPASHKYVSYLHQGNGLQSGETDTDPNDGGLIGKVYREQIFNSSGALLSETYTDWATTDLGNSRDFVRVSKVVISEDGKQTAQDATYNTTNGNLTTQVSYGKVTASTNTFTDTGTDKRTTTFTYTTGIVKPATVVVTDQSASKISEQKLYYDNLTLGSASVGNETKVESWVSGSTYINSQKSYNTKGQVVTETDPRGKVTTYTYDSPSLYAATVTNPLTQVTSFTYNYGVGKVKQTTDVNNLVYQVTYDGLGRIKEEKIPGDSTPYTPVTKTIYTYTDTASNFAIQKSSKLDASNSIESYQYLDGYGRPIQKRIENETSNSYDTTDTVYNNLGQVAKTSLPYAGTGSGKTAATTNSALLNVNAYDALGRTVSVTNALGAVTNAYNAYKTTVTDLRGKTKDLYKDAYDNLVQVDEHNGAATYSTYYEYNGQDNLVKITDALGNIRNITYDGLGRRLTAEDLHASGDTTFGVWIYAYDNSGNLTSTLDPKSQTLNYTYDDINRKTTENYTGSAGNEIVYAYDTCTLGVGKLCSSEVVGTTLSTYTYTSRGEIASESENTSNQSFTSSYVYDRQGNQIKIVNPDNSEVHYVYNSAGQLETISRKESGQALTSVVTDFDYGPHGKVVFQQNQNGTSTTNTYDAAKLYRLTNKLTVNSGGTKFQDTSFTYDNNGNILTQVDNSQTNTKKTVTYTYDDLNRLLSATSTNAVNGQNFSETYTYNAIGNITSKNGASYAYNGNQGNSFANPHAVTDIGTTTYTYDNNGNLISANGGTAPAWYGGGGGVSWYSGSGTWTDRKQIVVDETKIPGTAALTNYPLLVSLTDSALKTVANGGKVGKSDGSDILFTIDNTTKLSHEIEKYDAATGTLIAWVKIPSLSATANTTIYAYFGNASAADQQDKPGTWETNTKGVWHLNNGINDSTSNANNGTNYSSSNTTSGKIGDARNLTGASDRITTPNTTSLKPSSQITVSAWVKRNGAQVDYAKPLWFGQVAASPWGPYGFQFDATSDTSLLFHVSSNTTGYWMVPTTQVANNTWYHVVGTYDGSVIKYYINGQLEASQSATFTIGNYDTTNGLGIGDSYVPGSGLNGYVDEVRVMSTARSADWVAAEYNNQNNPSTFYAWGSVPTGGTWTNRKQITIDHTKVDGTSNLTNFPVLVNVTDVSLRSVANGGSVGKTDGTDILFTANDGVTKLSHEVEKYDPINGNLIAWVKVPTLSYTTDTVLILYYGNASSLDQQDKVNVWDSNTKGVWHFKETSGNFNDSTANGNNGVPTSVSSVSGKVGNGASFNGTSSSVNAGAGTSLNVTGNTLTIEAWVSKAVANNVGTIVNRGTGGVGGYTFAQSLGPCTSTQFKATKYAVADICLGTVPSDTSFHHLAMVWSASGVTAYVDGVSVGTSTNTSNFVTSTNSLAIGSGGSYLNGVVDELNISNTARSSSWIKTKYNNQNNPGTFLTLGAVVGAGNTAYTYDYRNKLTEAVVGTNTVNYGYDADGQRVKYQTPNTLTLYPSKYYNTDGATPLKHIFGNGQLVAMARGIGEGVSAYFDHNDHLASLGLTSNTAGSIEELNDYFPFGKLRLNEKTGTVSEQRKFAGHEFDSETELSYMEARYYNANIGRFTAQDAVVQTLPEDKLAIVLSNPQLLNSYSYGANNPIAYYDPDGNFLDTFWDAANVVYDAVKVAYNTGKAAVGAGQVIYAAVKKDSELSQKGINNLKSAGTGLKESVIDITVDSVSTLIPFVPAGSTKAIRVINKTDDVIDATKTVKKLPDSSIIAKPAKRGNAPIGKDGHPVELHHQNQKPEGPLKEMTRTDHRGAGNFTKNHTNTGQQQSKIDRIEWAKERMRYWKNQWDAGRFKPFK